MSWTTQDGPAIMAGYSWSIRLKAKAAVFLAGHTFTAQVRKTISDTTILATLTTANGGITRVSDTEVDLLIADTAAFESGSVFIDVVRTFPEPDQHLGFMLEVPVEKPVTRGL